LARLSAASLVLPCIDAGKGQVYARGYRVVDGACVPVTEEWVLAPDALCQLSKEVLGGLEWVLGGTGIDRYLAVFREAFGEDAVLVSVPGPSAIATGRLALERLHRGETDDLEAAVPRYGRPPDITRPRKPLLVP
jgi:tRNA A37 threonylcarbamoyladenosine modification protein TsaB